MRIEMGKRNDFCNDWIHECDSNYSFKTWWWHIFLSIKKSNLIKLSQVVRVDKYICRYVYGAVLKSNHWQCIFVDIQERDFVFIDPLLQRTTCDLHSSTGWLLWTHADRDLTWPSWIDRKRSSNASSSTPSKVIRTTAACTCASCCLCWLKTNRFRLMRLTLLSSTICVPTS